MRASTSVRKARKIRCSALSQTQRSSTHLLIPGTSSHLWLTHFTFTFTVRSSEAYTLLLYRVDPVQCSQSPTPDRDLPQTTTAVTLSPQGKNASEFAGVNCRKPVVLTTARAGRFSISLHSHRDAVIARPPPRLTKLYEAGRPI